MAEAAPSSMVDDFDDLLTCTICLESFKEPKFLPCLHTFCETCINTYISSSLEKEKCDGFKCPLCRQLVFISNYKGKPETWASNLPENHFVMSMLDKRSIKKSEKLCNACLINNENVKAISWCNFCEEAFCARCEKCHKTFKISSKHKIIPLEEFTKCDMPVSEVIICDDHPDKVVEVYCVDHVKHCCTLCATLIHRKCENVIPIEEAASGVKVSPQALELSNKMETFNVHLSEIIQNRKDNLTDIETETKNLSETIRKTKDEVVEHLHTLEEKLQDDLTSLKKQNLLKITDEIDKFSSFRSAVANWKTVFDGSLKHGSDKHCLVELNKIRPKMSIMEEEAKIALFAAKRVSFTVSLNRKLTDMMESIEKFGEINIVDSIQTELLHVDFETGNIKVLHTINTGGRSNYCSGLFVLDYIVITNDSTNKVHKYTVNGKSISELKLPTHPHDVAVVRQSKIVVSSHPGTLYIIDSENMTILQTMELENIMVSGISYIKEDDAFIGSHDKTLTWISASNGKKISEKTTNGNSYFVTRIAKCSYISGDDQNSVTCMEGQKVSFKYSSDKLSSPRGFGEDFQGNIYIVGRDSMNIHQITKNGKLIRIIPGSAFGTKRPRTINFAQNSNKFLVASHDGTATICIIE